MEELLFSCTAGGGSLDALRARERRTSREKVARRRGQPARLLEGDAAEPLRFEHRQPRRADPGRLPRPEGRQGPQHRQPRDHGGPGRIQEEHDIFICGDDCAAKAETRELLRSFGWPEDSIKDLGDISARARDRGVPAAVAAAHGHPRHGAVQHQGGAVGLLVAALRANRKVAAVADVRRSQPENSSTCRFWRASFDA